MNIEDINIEKGRQAKSPLFKPEKLSLQELFNYMEAIELNNRGGNFFDDVNDYGVTYKAIVEKLKEKTKEELAIDEQYGTDFVPENIKKWYENNT